MTIVNPNSPPCPHCGVLLANACTDCDNYKQWVALYEGASIAPEDWPEAPPVELRWHAVGGVVTDGSLRVRVVCPHCFASGPQVGNSIDAAIAEWNKLHAGPHRTWVRVPQ